jgi:hypothetical protein
MGKLVWKIMGTGAGRGADLMARRLVTTGWTVAVGKPPPGHASNSEASWPAAIGWAAASGALVGVARMVATRKAAAYYTKSAGHPPEALQQAG